MAEKGPVSYIGGKLFVKVGLPAAFTASGYAALTWTEVKQIVDIGEIGDSQADIPVAALHGRVEHVSGPSDLGEISISFRYVDLDPGQVILRAQAGSNADISFRIDDPDGQKLYFHGKIASCRDTARSAQSYKGQTAVIRGNSAVVRTAVTP